MNYMLSIVFLVLSLSAYSQNLAYLDALEKADKSNPILYFVKTNNNGYVQTDSLSIQELDPERIKAISVIKHYEDGDGNDLLVPARGVLFIELEKEYQDLYSFQYIDALFEFRKKGIEYKLEFNSDQRFTYQIFHKLPVDSFISSCEGAWKVDLENQTVELRCDDPELTDVLAMGFMKKREWSFEIISNKKVKNKEVVLTRKN